MGFSTLAGVLIVLMVAVTLAGFVVHGVVENVKELSKVSKLERYREIALKNTDFEIVNVSASNASSNTYILKVIVKNAGATTLNCTKFSLIVDGVLINYSVNTTLLYPLHYAEFTSELDGGVGTVHRLLVVSNNGVIRIASYEVV